MAEETARKPESSRSVLDHVLGAVTALLMAGVVLLTIFQVLCRFVFFFPAPWVEESVSFLFVWLIFAGAALAQRGDEHTRIELVPMVLPERVKTWVAGFGDLLVLAFLAVVVVTGLELARATMPMPSQVIGWPMGVFYLSAPVGGAVMALATVGGIIRRVRAKKPS